MDIVERLRLRPAREMLYIDGCVAAGYGPTIEAQAADEIDRLRSELCAARADAERYRWLRSANTGKPLAVVTTGSAWRCTLNTVELDAAIDAALALEKK